jgi:hypothetical protein
LHGTFKPVEKFGFQAVQMIGKRFCMPSIVRFTGASNRGESVLQKKGVTGHE